MFDFSPIPFSKEGWNNFDKIFKPTEEKIMPKKIKKKGKGKGPYKGGK